MINRLEGEGWVERRPHPADGRTTLAVLTDSGAAKVEESIEAVARIDFGFSGAGDGTLDALVDALAACQRPEVRDRGAEEVEPL